MNNANLKTKHARNRLPNGSKLHITGLLPGLHLGFRRSSTQGRPGGHWYARWHLGSSKYQFQHLGPSEESPDATWGQGLTFEDAERKAREFGERKKMEQTGEVIAGPHSVDQALDDYMQNLKVRKEGEHEDTASVIESKIKPNLGRYQLSELKRKQVEDWFHGMVKAGNTKATANRNLTVLRAALNYAYRENRIAVKWWDKIQPYKGVTKSRAHYLTVEECKRLIESSSGDFRALVRAALYTGCRYGELTAMRCNAFNPSTNMLHIPKSKSGKPRNIALTDEGAAFFTGAVAGKDGNDLIFTHAAGRHKGEAWKRTQQTFHMKAACKAADIKYCGFHTLRHSVASWLKMNHADSMTIAKQLGHRDTRMVELHYGHLDEGWFANEIRSKLPNID